MSATQAPTSDEDERSPALLAAISNEFVRLYKEQFGRGPTKARTEWAGPNVVLVTLEDTLTPAERNLAKLGEHQKLRDVRLFFQHATEPQFAEAIERLTGRTVRAFVSGMDTHADMSAEVFYLYPRGQEGPSVAERPPSF